MRREAAATLPSTSRWLPGGAGGHAQRGSYEHDGLLGEVAVEDELVAVASQIRALHRVEEIASGSVGVAAAVASRKREEDPAPGVDKRYRKSGHPGIAFLRTFSRPCWIRPHSSLRLS